MNKIRKRKRRSLLLTKRFVDSPDDQKTQEYFRARSGYSIAVLGEAFVRNGSGMYLNIRRVDKAKKHLSKKDEEQACAAG